MTLVRGVNVLVRFLLELCMLWAVGYWGFTTQLSWLGKVGLGVGGPLLLAVLWGCFGAPKALFPLHGVALLLFELLIFGMAPLALIAAGQPALAAAFGIVYLVNKILLTVW